MASHVFTRPSHSRYFERLKIYRSYARSVERGSRGKFSHFFPRALFPLARMTEIARPRERLSGNAFLTETRFSALSLSLLSPSRYFFFFSSVSFHCDQPARLWYSHDITLSFSLSLSLPPTPQFRLPRGGTCRIQFAAVRDCFLEIDSLTADATVVQLASRHDHIPFFCVSFVILCCYSVCHKTTQSLKPIQLFGFYCGQLRCQKFIV